MSNFLPMKSGFSGWVPERFRGDFDDLWNRFFDDFDSMFGNCCYESKDGNVVYEVEVPGFSKDDINVTLSNGVLEVKGERKIEEGIKTAGQRSIYKKMKVGEVIDADAVVKDGILKVTLKYPEKPDENVKVLEVKDVEE